MVEPTLTMRIIYHTLASQYGPMEYIIHFKTRAKILEQELWTKERVWDNPFYRHTY